MTRRRTDENSVKMVGVVSRPPVLIRGQYEFTLAGERFTDHGRRLPWFHRVAARPETLDGGQVPTAGQVVRVEGRVEQVKWRTAGQSRQLVQVRAASVEETHADAEVVQGEGGAFLLLGGMNEVRLSGNLTHDATATLVPGGDRLTRLRLAVAEDLGGGRETTHFLVAKAWRRPGVQTEHLRTGARLGLAGTLVSESFSDKDEQKRNSVVIEVRLCRTA